MVVEYSFVVLFAFFVVALNLICVPFPFDWDSHAPKKKDYTKVASSVSIQFNHIEIKSRHQNLFRGYIFIFNIDRKRQY